MPNALLAPPNRAPWELMACGPDGSGPFRLVVHYADCSVTEYFHDVADAFHVIEDAEKRPGAKAAPLVSNRLLIEIPDDLVKQCFNEEGWANGLRH